MKEICRDFTIIISVPDHVSPDDCEIIVEKFSASYRDKGVTVNIKEDSEHIDLLAEDPYDEYQ